MGEERPSATDICEKILAISRPIGDILPPELTRAEAQWLMEFAVYNFRESQAASHLIAMIDLDGVEQAIYATPRARVVIDGVVYDAVKVRVGFQIVRSHPATEEIIR